ncbi:MAG: hypothetical protein M5U24_09540 [Candidatus Kuenenia sp.]|nr:MULTISPECIES: hypothetical protein [Kuenenia]MCZ7622712.1 hypothetical protein [Candidatus Kuenenia sp.]
MATDLTKTQWTGILLNEELTSQVGVILGYKGKSPHGALNLEMKL